MACRKCGGGGSKSSLVLNNSNESGVASAEGERVLIEYIGPGKQKRRIRSKVHFREFYEYSEGSQFRAYPGDVNFLLSMPDKFRLAKVEEIKRPLASVAEVPVVRSEMRPPVAEVPLDAVVDLDPVILGFLKRAGLHTVQQVKLMSDSDLLLIKGIKQNRLKLIREALK